MFIFNRSFWAVGAGLATACAIVAASFVLDRPPSPPGAQQTEVTYRLHEV